MSDFARNAAILCFTCLFIGSATPAAQQPAVRSETASPGSFVQVLGGKLYYEECGSGPRTVLLIHDGIVHSAVWDDVWPAFCKKFHTVRYDRRGYGRSPAPPAPYWETEDITAILRHLRIPRAILVGSSHGGELSIDFTLQHPDMVEQLVLVGAVVSGLPYTDHFLLRGVQNSKPFEKNDVTAGITNWANDKYLLAPAHEKARTRLLELLKANPQDLTHQDLTRPIQPALPRLREIHVPTLILTGDVDIPDVHAHAGAIEAGIPGSRRVVLHDAGHLMYMEIPEEFTQAVIRFIETGTL